MTRGRKILTWSLASLVLLLAALVVFIATFDWNLIKPTLNEKVSAALNRPFAINGNLAVAWRREEGEEGWRAWIPWPRFSAEDITLGNPEWTAGKTKASEFASLERIEFRLAPLPLLWQTIRIPQIKLTQPRADLLRLADGRANWDFDLPASDSDEPSAWQLDIREIGFDKGSVSL
ncbi:AsmA family protein, partial [Pseudomonas aeruginosa]